MGMIRWLNRHRWSFALLWAVPALFLAAVSRTWRVGAVLLIWIPLAIAVAWLYFTALEKEMKQARDALERCDPEPLLRTSRELAEGKVLYFPCLVSKRRGSGRISDPFEIRKRIRKRENERNGCGKLSD